MNIELNEIIMDEKIRKNSEDYDECNEPNVECKRRGIYNENNGKKVDDETKWNSNG